MQLVRMVFRSHTSIMWRWVGLCMCFASWWGLVNMYQRTALKES